MVEVSASIFFESKCLTLSSSQHLDTLVRLALSFDNIAIKYLRDHCFMKGVVEGHVCASSAKKGKQYGYSS